MGRGPIWGVALLPLYPLLEKFNFPPSERDYEKVPQFQAAIDSVYGSH